MRLARVDMPTDVPLSFKAALIAADAVEADVETDSYAPVAGTDREALIVNRVASDGTMWTAVAAVAPSGTAVRVLFVNGGGRQGNMFDIPHHCGAGLSESERRSVVGLVLAAPREFARRLCSGDIVLDRLIEVAWLDSQALELAAAEYQSLEQRLVADSQ